MPKLGRKLTDPTYGVKRVRKALPSPELGGPMPTEDGGGVRKGWLEHPKSPDRYTHA